MVKWILWLFFLFEIWGCQSAPTVDDSKASLATTSETAVSAPQTAVSLVFFLKEWGILNNSGTISLRDTALFRSLPPGVYPIKSDTIIFGKPPREWISSGITRWPASGRVALTDFIISDHPLSTKEIAIFPQKPDIDGYLPGCFSCPDWMAQQYGILSIFWKKHF